MRYMNIGKSIMTALALCAMAIMGCAAQSEQLGSTSQAVINTLSLTGTPPAVEFAAYYPLTSNKLLIVGGYVSGGTGTTEMGILDVDALTYDKLRNDTDTADLALPSNRGEQQIMAVPGMSDTYLIAGGRAARDGAAVASSYLLVLTSLVPPYTASLTTGGNMVTAVVIDDKNLQTCGDENGIVLGGITDHAMTDIDNTAATDDIQVATFTASPLGVTWARLLNASDVNVNRPVKLQTARGYNPILHVSDTSFRAAGGTKNGSLALNTAETLTVNAACRATNATNVGMGGAIDYRTPFGNNLAQPLARSVWAAQNTTFTPTGGSSTTFEFILGGGNVNTSGSGAKYDLATQPQAYDVGTDTWALIPSCTITGRTYSRFVNDGSQLKLATGIQPQTSAPQAPLYDTSAVNKITLISTSGVCSNQQTMGVDDTFSNSATRVGAIAGFLDSLSIVGQGANHITNQAATELSTVLSF